MTAVDKYWVSAGINRETPNLAFVLRGGHFDFLSFFFGIRADLTYFISTIRFITHFK